MDFETTLGQLINDPMSVNLNLIFGTWIIWLIIHFIFASAVYRDGKSIKTVLAGEKTWATVTLLGGVWFAIGYWAVHHSVLAKNSDTGS